MKLEVDQYFYLTGDEDGDVSLNCRVCDCEPIVFYTSDPKTTYYANTNTVIVYTISDMFAPASKHIARHRAEGTTPSRLKSKRKN